MSSTTEEPCKEMPKRTLSQLELTERTLGFGNEDESAEAVVWFCCRGGRTDSRLLQFIVSTGMSVIIVIFCIVQLVRLDEPVAQNTYISLLTLVFGIFIPTPKVNHK